MSSVSGYLANRGITREKILRAFSMHKSANAVARVLGISHVTVLKYLREEGVEILSRGKHPPGAKYRYPHRSAVAKWIEKNPGRAPNVAMIASETDVSQNAVKCYLSRRRRLVASAFSAAPDLRRVNGAFEDVDGNWWDLDQIEDYTLHHGRHSFWSRVDCIMDSGDEVSFMLPDIRAILDPVGLVLQITKEEQDLFRLVEHSADNSSPSDTDTSPEPDEDTVAVVDHLQDQSETEAQ